METADCDCKGSGSPTSSADWACTPLLHWGTTDCPLKTYIRVCWCLSFGRFRECFSAAKKMTSWRQEIWLRFIFAMWFFWVLFFFQERRQSAATDTHAGDPHGSFWGVTVSVKAVTYLMITQASELCSTTGPRKSTSLSHFLSFLWHSNNAAISSNLAS